MDDAPRGTSAAETITREELQLAARNHGMPLEALRWDRTPVGLHYLLIHYDVPAIDPEVWRLRVGGSVERALSLSLADLHARPPTTIPVTLECAGNGRARFSPRALSQPWLHEAVGTADWTGVPLAPLLDEAGLADSAVDVVFSGADRGVEGGVAQRYERSLSVAAARSEDALLAYAINGQPLPPQHGAPLRLLVPGWYGMASVKWLTDITVVDEPFTGYQQAHAYRLRTEPEEAGEPLTRIAVRSLMAPPGIPDFFTRQRFIDLSDCPCQITGRAWSGHGPITAVEFSDDGGSTWRETSLDVAPGRYAWQRWTVDWRPEKAGEYELACRATDAAGNRQPTDASWNLGGYVGNDIHRVAVTVASTGSG